MKARQVQRIANGEDPILEKIKAALDKALPESENVAGVFAAYLPCDSNLIGMTYQPPTGMRHECPEQHVIENYEGPAARIRFLEMIRDVIDQKIEKLKSAS